LSSIGASVNAKRAACVHLLFNVAGCIIFIFPVAFAGKYIATFLDSLIAKTEWQIAIFHMVFNLVTTLILCPFVKQLVQLACLIVPDKKGEKEEDSETLDKRLLKTPAIAVGQTRKQILKMADAAYTNYKLSVEILLTGDLSKKDEFAKRERGIDGMNKYIINFLIQLSLQEISEVDEKKVSSFYHVTSDIERIGDYAENIVEFAEKIYEDKVDFSDQAKDEIREMDRHISALYDYVCKVFANSDLSYLPDVEREENATDNMNNLMQQSHLQRMNEGQCSAEAGSLFLQLAVNMERIGDHMNNVAHSVIPYGHGAVASH
jgi:phosphate:Na+ symporter